MYLIRMTFFLRGGGTFVSGESVAKESSLSGSEGIIAQRRGVKTFPTRTSGLEVAADGGDGARGTGKGR